MANMQRLLEDLARRLEVSRAGVSLYHTAMGASAEGRKKVEAMMVENETMVTSVIQKLCLVQMATKNGDLASVQRLLDEDIALPPKTP